MQKVVQVEKKKWNINVHLVIISFSLPLPFKHIFGNKSEMIISISKPPLSSSPCGAQRVCWSSRTGRSGICLWCRYRSRSRPWWAARGWTRPFSCWMEFKAISHDTPMRWNKVQHAYHFLTEFQSTVRPKQLNSEMVFTVWAKRNPGPTDGQQRREWWKM